MEAAVHLLTILITALAFGHVAEMIKLPAAVGQVLAGVTITLIGSTFALPFLQDIASSTAVQGVGEAGIIFLLLYAGIEMKPTEIAQHRTEAFAVAAGGVIVPLALGFGLAWYALPQSEVLEVQAFVVGVALSITAIAVAAKVFMDFGLLHHPIGQVTISAAVIDDIIGLVLLAIVTEVIATGAAPGVPELAIMLAKVAIFFGLTWVIGHRLTLRFWAMVHKLHMTGARLVALLFVALIYGLFAEALGLHFILGPFMAGLYFEPERVGAKAYATVDRTVKSLSKGVLGPVFFASIGLTVDLGALVETPIFLGALLLVAMLGKLLGCGLPAYLINGHKPRDAVAIGIGMSGRGAVELFIVSIAHQAGLFSIGDTSHPILANMYSALVLTAIITTALTPLLLRLVLRHHRP